MEIDFNIDDLTFRYINWRTIGSTVMTLGNKMAMRVPRVNSAVCIFQVKLVNNL